MQVQIGLLLPFAVGQVPFGPHKDYHNYCLLVIAEVGVSASLGRWRHVGGRGGGVVESAPVGERRSLVACLTEGVIDV